MAGIAQSPTLSARQAHRLVQVGLLLFLAAMIVGVLIPKFGIPRVGLSVHLLGLLQGIFLVVIGLLWPKLHFGRSLSRAAFWLLIYGCLSAWTASVLAGTFRAGGNLLPMAAGAVHGTAFQEWIISIGLRSAAVSLIVALLILLWATRHVANIEPTDKP